MKPVTKYLLAVSLLLCGFFIGRFFGKSEGPVVRVMQFAPPYAPTLCRRTLTVGHTTKKIADLFPGECTAVREGDVCIKDCELSSPEHLEGSANVDITQDAKPYIKMCSGLTGKCDNDPPIESTTITRKPEPMDVPAIRVEFSTPVTHYGCADKSRILLTDESGGKHCVSFKDRP